MSKAAQLATLVGLHAVMDYPLQGEFLARAKNRQNPIPGVPWYQALLAHSAIHGLAVGLALNSLKLGLAETVAHAIIDDTKCAGYLTYDQDQAMHVACKCLWTLLASNKESLNANTYR